MFEIFQNAFRRGRGDPLPDTGPSPEPGQLLAARFGGSTFERGLYRVLPLTDVPKVKKLVDAGFPFLGRRVLPFSTDWLGRVFAADTGRLDRGEPMVLMLEPGTGEALEIPCTIQSFHDRELIEYKDAALAAPFYEAWLDLGGSIPEATQCIGYRKPLFLGGKDEVSNLEVADLDVYWTLTTQLRVGIQ